MTSKAYRDNYKLIDWSGLKPSKPKARKFKRGFYVIPDMQPYCSPIDGRVIGGRRQHREHMQEHDVVERGTDKPKPHKYEPMPDAKRDVAEALRQHGIIG